jgi:hypothetical protein
LSGLHALLNNLIAPSHFTRRKSQNRSIAALASNLNTALNGYHALLNNLITLSHSTCHKSQNRSIATLAITTLLKTGSEGSVEKLLKQIGTFMSDIAGVCASVCAMCTCMGLCIYVY